MNDRPSGDGGADWSHFVAGRVAEENFETPGAAGAFGLFFRLAIAKVILRCFPRHD